MQNNGRPPILASSFSVLALDLRDPKPFRAKCPDCGTWNRLCRGQTKDRGTGHKPAGTIRLFPGHDDPKATGSTRRCKGAGQRITLDITPADWHQQLGGRHATLTASRMPATHLNLREGEEHSAICPDCRSWTLLWGTDGRPATVRQAGQDRVYGVHTNRATGDLCDGSGRRLRIDVGLHEWMTNLLTIQVDVNAPRPTTVHKKPRALPAPAVTQMQHVRLTPEVAQRRLRDHRTGCHQCRHAVNSHVLRPCHDGQTLAATVLWLQSRETHRRDITRFLAEERARFDKLYASRRPQERRRQWAELEPATKAADAARIPRVRLLREVLPHTDSSRRAELLHLLDEFDDGRFAALAPR